MENYPSNSRSRREPNVEREKVERITEGTVVRRKKSLGKRFAETFVGGDTRSVGSFVFLDVLLPAMRDMVADTVSMGVERLVYGESRGPSRRPGYRPGGMATHTPYNRMSAGVRPEPRMSHRARATHDFGEIVLQTRHEAQDVLDKMFQLCLKYEQVTLSELYDLVGETPAYTDDKYGWTDLTGADIRRTRDGYLLDLPRPEALG